MPTAFAAAVTEFSRGEDVDAVLVLVHHPLDAADLPLDTAEPVLQVLLVHAVTGHAAEPPRAASVTIPWGELYRQPRRASRRRPGASMGRC